MNLVIDIGNTRTKFGIFESEALIAQDSIHGVPDATTLASWHDHYPIRYSAIASVGSDIKGLVANLRWSHTLYVDQSTPMPITTRYSTPETLGMDRLCGAVAAHRRFPQEPVLIIDAGSCITYDIVTPEGEHLGGGISPGLNMRLKAMHAFTERLPEVNAPTSIPQIGTDTGGSMQFGAYLGVVHEMNGIMAQLRAEYPNLKVILTGGDYSTFEQRLENPIFAAPNLVLEGIHHILLHNVRTE